MTQCSLPALQLQGLISQGGITDPGLSPFLDRASHRGVRRLDKIPKVVDSVPQGLKHGFFGIVLQLQLMVQKVFDLDGKSRQKVFFRLK